MVERRLSPPLDDNRKEKARLAKQAILSARQIRDAFEEKRCTECSPETVLKAFFSTLVDLTDLGISLEQAIQMISPLSSLDKPTLPDANREELRRTKARQGKRIKAILKNASGSTITLNDKYGIPFGFIEPSTLEKILKSIGEDLETLAPSTNGEGRATEVIPL